MGTGNKVAIFSRYKENNSFWHDTVKQFKYEIQIYNKFDGENLLPNVGREGHTYLHYIVNNYHKLPNEILFSQFDPIDHFKENTMWNEKNMHSNMKKFLSGFLYDFISIRPTDFDLWVRDRKIDWIKYCKELFGIFENQHINKLISCGANLNGVFRVHRRAILRRPLSFYEKCLQLLSKDVDPDEGYFFERIWKFIFTNYGCNNKNYNYFTNNYFLFGTDEFIDPKWKRRSNALASNFSGNVISDRSWKDNAYGHIFLHESGCLLSNSHNISLYGSPNEIYWSIESDNYLRFFDANGAVTSIFKLDNIKWPLKGFHYNGIKRFNQFHWLKQKMFM